LTNIIKKQQAENHRDILLWFPEVGNCSLRYFDIEE
jgi:hypothetical protein